MLVIEGFLNKIIFHNSDTNYYILSIFLNQTYEAFPTNYVSVVGNFEGIDLIEEELYEFRGEIVNHKKFGLQFSAISAEKTIKKDKDSIIEYLSSATFPGIGRKTAELIVDKLGTNCLDLIFENKDVLYTIDDLAQTKKEVIYKNILANKQSQETLLQLNELGFGNKTIQKIYNHYKARSLEVIKNNPYELTETISGIGFTTMDRIAEKLGIEADDMNRIKQAIIFSAKELSYGNGDTFINSNTLLYNSFNTLYKSRKRTLEKELLISALNICVEDGKLIKREDKIFLAEVYYSEYGIYDNIKNRLETDTFQNIDNELLDKYIKEIEVELDIQYAFEQVQAIKNSINNNFSILTGGPGTGKTTIILAIIKIFQKIYNYSYEDLLDETKSIICLCAPTGKAAKRISESTGFNASTIHKTIGWTNEDTNINEFTSDKKINSKLVIIDEASMIDVFLMYNLLKIIDSTSKIIIVGDTEQLPSISPGNVLKDLIDSGEIPTTQLNKIFRQAEDSSIIKLSYSIKNNLPVDILENFPDREFILANKEDIIDSLLSIYSKLLETTPSEKIQILIPLYKTEYGIHNINKIIQERFNSHETFIEYGEFLYKVNDRVMQLENRAEDNIFNGDIGIIEDIYKEDNVHKIVVNYDDNHIIYEKKDLNQIILAYACSIHKSQGSEFDYVILPLVDNYKFMYNKNLIYTAITRSKKKLFFCGNKNLFYDASRADNIIKRNSFLRDLFTINIKEDTNPTTYILTTNNIYTIDPMIGMDNVSLYEKNAD